MDCKIYSRVVRIAKQRYCLIYRKPESLDVVSLTNQREYDDTRDRGATLRLSDTVVTQYWGHKALFLNSSFKI